MTVTGDSNLTSQSNGPGLGLRAGLDDSHGHGHGHGVTSHHNCLSLGAPGPRGGGRRPQPRSRHSAWPLRRRSLNSHGSDGISSRPPHPHVCIHHHGSDSDDQRRPPSALQLERDTVAVYEFAHICRGGSESTISSACVAIRPRARHEGLRV